MNDELFPKGLSSKKYGIIKDIKFESNLKIKKEVYE